MADFAERTVSVLQSKREATRYRILVEIAERQPAVSQREIAEAIGITSQAVSDYLGTLIDEEHVEKEGRGRYVITKEGVDWLISRTDDLQRFLDHVTADVLEEVEIEAAIATADIEDGQPVHLSMKDGLLHATPGSDDGATAIAVGDARESEAVGVTDFEGILEFEPGTVTIVSVPAIGTDEPGPSPEAIGERAAEHDLVATAGVEALALLRRADCPPDIRFGTAQAVREAATRGLDVLLVSVTTAIGEHANALREGNVSYEVVDPNA